MIGSACSPVTAGILPSYRWPNAGVAQLVRASPCHGEGHRFESGRPRKYTSAPSGALLVYWSMRIKPSLVTGTATIVALAAVGVVVVSTEPTQAQPELIWLLWFALFLAAWGLLCTAMLLLRQSMAQSLWTALIPAMTAIGLLMTFQRGILGKNLLGGVIFVSVMLSFVIWWRLRRARIQH